MFFRRTAPGQNSVYPFVEVCAAIPSGRGQTQKVTSACGGSGCFLPQQMDDSSGSTKALRSSSKTPLLCQLSHATIGSFYGSLSDPGSLGQVYPRSILTDTLVVQKLVLFPVDMHHCVDHLADSLHHFFSKFLPGSQDSLDAQDSLAAKLVCRNIWKEFPLMELDSLESHQTTLVVMEVMGRKITLLHSKKKVKVLTTKSATSSFWKSCFHPSQTLVSKAKSSP